MQVFRTRGSTNLMYNALSISTCQKGSRSTVFLTRIPRTTKRYPETCVPNQQKSTCNGQTNSRTADHNLRLTYDHGIVFCTELIWTTRTTAVTVCSRLWPSERVYAGSTSSCGSCNCGSRNFATIGATRWTAESCFGNGGRDRVQAGQGGKNITRYDLEWLGGQHVYQTGWTLAGGLRRWQGGDGKAGSSCCLRASNTRMSRNGASATKLQCKCHSPRSMWNRRTKGNAQTHLRFHVWQFLQVFEWTQENTPPTRRLLSPIWERLAPIEKPSKALWRNHQTIGIYHFSYVFCPNRHDYWRHCRQEPCGTLLIDHVIHGDNAQIWPGQNQ